MDTNDFTRRTVKKWMSRRLEAEPGTYTDSAGEVNCTALAEAAADAFGKNDMGGPLDDSDHWIWEASAEVAFRFEAMRTGRRAA